MICRPSQQGQRLDVAGLNEIIVLVDRSETQLTEVGLNTWRKGLEGPPHSHDAKEQIFYVTAGVGEVVVGNARYSVRPGSLVYVPPRVVHQSIVTGDAPLTYLLFNAFLDASKEGHASFAEHIEKVKLVRKQQAESRRADVASADAVGAVTDRAGKHVADVLPGGAFGASLGTARAVLDRSETARSEVTLVKRSAGSTSDGITHPNTEQTCFVLSGRGRFRAGSDACEVNVGDVVFIPWNTAYTVETGAEALEYLCFDTFVTGAR
jgi:quercetin dioxygenase-like cupin family protein